MTLLSEMRAMLAPRHGEREARALALLLLQRLTGRTTAQILCDGAGAEEGPRRAEIMAMARRVADGDPVQYVLGTEDFHGLRLAVSPAALIPRPETSALVDLVLADRDRTSAPDILDAGTGTGCIALALKQALPRARVEAWDLSAAALALAGENARRTHLDVTFRRHDILAADDGTPRRFDILVSNPPYVLRSERPTMSPVVLDHEPEEALFVSDDDPLLFYRALARSGRRLLRRGGGIYFETNTRFCDAVAALLGQSGYVGVATHQDIFDRPRFVTARLGE